MSTFTAVDLSRLPPPALVEPLDYETILAKRIAKFRELFPDFDGLTESDPSIIHLQESAYRELVFRQRVNDAAKGGMLAYATGTDLDHIGARDNITRYMLDPGDPSRGIPPIFESDADFRRRIQLAPEGFSVAGPEGAYIFHALSADPDVLDASATSPAPGEVLVTVLARRGDGTASPALVSAVERVLTDDRIRPLTDYVKVQSARIVPFEVRATVYTYAGPDSSLVIDESVKRLRRYIEESHRLGRDVPRSGLFSVLHSEGVQRVELHSPAADIVIDRTQATNCTAVDIAVGGVDE
ncbi:baseplate assembly protein [Lysobacter gummosus]|uniref:Baseplate J/gp47 family protein n=1 Tax=Lysobacter gummosus TaxID=262324 RepID=A0ABY3X693_9GAMM|nr:baseplate J/gp47 family protein [Lysobacter gummosus]ALN92518.1 baseplate J-like family protein [Lysobacter gummosus]UNP28094.1 baseplate J/gp47 family protein [Lysobacter gummosus]